MQTTKNGTPPAEEQAQGEVVLNNTITWGELTEMKSKTIILPQYNNQTITYRTMIPLDKMAEMVARHMSQTPKDYLGFYCAILSYAIVQPPIPKDMLRVVVKANSAVMMQIVGDVTNAETRKELEDGLGSSLGES